MNRSKRIKNILEKHFNDYSIVVLDNSYLHKGHNNFNGTGETHLILKLSKINESKLDRLKIHNKINSLLKDEFDKGLHALEIKIIL